MVAKVPIRTVFDDENNATGLAEFQSGEFIGLAYGGLGASLSLGTANQILKVNSGGTALEFGNVENVLNIDGLSDGTGITIADTDQFAISDATTEKRINASQIVSYVQSNISALGATSIADGSVSNTEFQYLNGVTSAIQTQLDAKQAVVAGVDDTEIGYLNGVTSAIQTQLDAKASQPFAIAQAIALG